MPPNLVELQELRNIISNVVRHPKVFGASANDEVRVPLKLREWGALLATLELVLAKAYERKQKGNLN
jgi:hypothetical protein